MAAPVLQQPEVLTIRDENDVPERVVLSWDPSTARLFGIEGPVRAGRVLTSYDVRKPDPSRQRKRKEAVRG